MVGKVHTDHPPLISIMTSVTKSNLVTQSGRMVSLKSIMPPNLDIREESLSILGCSWVITERSYKDFDKPVKFINIYLLCCL